MKKDKVSVLSRLVGHIGLLVLVAISIVLVKERVIFIDSAVQLFEMIQHGSFAIYDHRLPMAITQALPLLSIQLGLSLKAVAIAYSLSAPLLAYVVFLIIAYGLKDDRTALLFLFSLLCVRHTFFHAISETFSLFIYATLLAALFCYAPSSRRGQIVRTLGMVLCTVVAVFIHPVGMFFVLYLIGYRLIVGGCHDRMALLSTAIALVLASVVNLLIPSGHNAGYTVSLSDVRYCLSHFFDLNIVRGFLDNIDSLYLFPLLFYGIVAVWHCRHRQWPRLAYGMMFNMGFILMTAVVYQSEGSPIAVERSWLPLVFFSGMPLLQEVLPHLRRPKQYAAVAFLAIALLFSVVMIVRTAKPYHQRIEQLELIAEMGNREGQHKLVADATTATEAMVGGSWCTAFESMLVSAWHGPSHTVTLFVEKGALDPTNADYREPHSFLGVPWWRLWYYDVLRPQYFALPDLPYARLTLVDGQLGVNSL